MQLHASKAFDRFYDGCGFFFCSLFVSLFVSYLLLVLGCQYRPILLVYLSIVIILINRYS
jgi:hypothetical protein